MLRGRAKMIQFALFKCLVRGKVALVSGQFAQDSVGSEIKVPRHGSIYDRLEKARAERLKSLGPQTAANDAPKPTVRSKSGLLPNIKPQEEYDPPQKQGLPKAAKLGLGVLAFSIMAGFSLLDWGANGLQTDVKAPTSGVPVAGETQLPAGDEPARVANAPKVDAAPSDDLPLVPSAPSGPVVVEVQQDTQSLNVPVSTEVQQP